VIGRYALHAELACGGMATVHIGRMFGPAGFQRTVAIKRLLPHLAREPEFVARFLDEARIAARIMHPNVVPTLDVVAADGEIFLVMEYVQGESLSRLMRTGASRRLPVDVACAIAECMLAGLHAAHEARDERGNPLDIVHRDISPQNVIVGTDGVARVFDFGIAKAIGRSQITTDGAIRGKFGYMAPEQLGGDVTRATDIYAASIVLWECLTGERYFRGDSDAALIAQILMPPRTSTRSIAPEVPEAVDAVVLRGLSPDPAERFADAREMALALSNACRSASAIRVATFVEGMAAESLAERADLVALVESTPALELAPRADGQPSSLRLRAAADARQPSAPRPSLATAVAAPAGAEVLAVPKRGKGRLVGLGVLMVSGAIALAAFGRQVGLAEERDAGPVPVASAARPSSSSEHDETAPPVVSSDPAATASSPASAVSARKPPPAPARLPASSSPHAAPARGPLAKGTTPTAPTKPLKMDLE